MTWPCPTKAHATTEIRPLRVSNESTGGYLETGNLSASVHCFEHRSLELSRLFYLPPSFGVLVSRLSGCSSALLSSLGRCYRVSLCQLLGSEANKPNLREACRPRRSFHKKSDHSGRKDIIWSLAIVSKQGVEAASWMSAELP